MNKTRIFSAGKGISAKDLMANTQIEADFWFPEIIWVHGTALPRNQHEQHFLLPKLLGKTIVTLSEIIILAFLREVRKGRMRTDELELYCDSRRIRVATNGDMIDYWDGGFFELGFNLRFH